MIYAFSWTAVAIFGLFVGIVLGMSFWLGSRAKSSQGYYAAHGQIHWFVNGIAFAGDYLSAASFLGICGMIAWYGYDGFLYSIGYLAGWIVALFIVAEPIKHLGKFTFADALDSRFKSRGIKLAAAISTMVVSIFYLIPQMVGAGALIKPLLGFPHYAGVLIVGVVVVTIVATAGMVSTTYVQFIKGSLLVFFCTLLTIAILFRGLSTEPKVEGRETHRFISGATLDQLTTSTPRTVVPDTEDGGWSGTPYVRLRDVSDKTLSIWRKGKDGTYSETQWTATGKDGKKLVNGKPQGIGPGQADFIPVGQLSAIPGGSKETGALGPFAFLSKLNDSTVVLWGTDKVTDAQGVATTIYFQKPTSGSDILTPGASPTFANVRKQWPPALSAGDAGNSEKAAAHDKSVQDYVAGKLDFISLMLALFCGTASLPHVLIRYYTVKDPVGVRKSTVVGIAAIGFFYVLTLYLGLGAMTSGAMDITNNNMAAPLLARTFGELPFAVISAIAFTTVLGTVSGLIMAASGAVAHDLMGGLMNMKMSDHAQVLAGKFAAVGVGSVAMVLGILFEKMNVSFLVGWAFNIAASANLPSLIMLLFWPKTTKRGIAASVIVGMTSSLGWILLSTDVYKNVYGITPGPHTLVMPFSQPALVTVPLSFATLVVVSLMTQPRNASQKA